MSRKRTTAIVIVFMLLITMFVMAACSNNDTGGGGGGGEAEPAVEEPAPAPVEEAAADAVEGDIPEGLEIAYYVSTLNNGYHQGDANWATKYAKEAYGANITVMDGKSDNKVMAENAELTYAGGYDMASWFVWEGETIVQTVRDCIDGGMTSNMFYQGVGDIEMPFIYTIESVASEEMGKVAATKWKEWYPDKPIKYAVIGWMENPTVDKERTFPFIDGVKSVDADAEEVGMLDAAGGTEAAYAVAQDLLQAHPDVNIIYAESNDLVIGVMTALTEVGRGTAVDGVCDTEIVCSTDAPEQEIKDIYDPSCALKVTMSMTPKDNAIARLDNLMEIYTGKMDQNTLTIINTYDKELDFWNTKPEDAIEFFNVQYMGNLTLADLGL
ncbi:MAG: substrate-binding domain-containing protein [Clostridiales bacterium]|nr:substrate-binding domain-containing protein [Clostridiales bacterium]